MSNPLNDIAPYPATVDEVTADSLGRYLAVRGWAHRTHRKYATSSTDRERATSEIVDTFGVVSVLRVLQAAAPDTADKAAKDLWLAWDDGGAVDEWLHSWLTGYGIDPEQVNEVAAGLMREAA